MIKDFLIPKDLQEVINSKGYELEKKYKNLTVLDDPKLDTWFENQLKDDTKRGYLYEHYIGYLLEQLKYKVDYHGIISLQAGNPDGGIDLIAENDECTLIIQCKNYGEKSKITSKTIREHHTVVEKKEDEYSNKKIYGAIFGTSAFGKNIKKEAKEDKISLFCIELPKRFHVLKCKKTHGYYCFPADKGYYTLEINNDNGDCYCLTVKEAEEKGFTQSKY